MFWATLVLIGVATGLIGAALMALLFEVEHLAFDFRTGDLQSAVERASGARRVGSLLIAKVFGGVAWYVLRRVTKGRKSEIDDACGRAATMCRSVVRSGPALSPRS